MALLLVWGAAYAVIFAAACNATGSGLTALGITVGVYILAPFPPAPPPPRSLFR